MHVRHFNDTYLSCMKGKLTLSLDPKRIAKLRRASIRRKTTITALVEELADRLDASQEKAGKDWLDEMKGALTGRISRKDLADDPKLAHILGKSASGK